MKKAFLFLAFATMLLSATKLQAQIGFQAGYAPQRLKTTNALTDEYSSTLLHGFYAGVHYTFGIVENFDIIPAVQVRMNSATVKGDVINTQYWQLAMDVPVLLSYSYPVYQDIRIGAFAGPVASVGFSFTEKQYQQKPSEPGQYEIVSTTDYYSADTRKRFEMNAAVGLYFQYKTYMLYGGYSFGLNNLDKRENFTTRTGAFLVGIAIH